MDPEVELQRYLEQLESELNTDDIYTSVIHIKSDGSFNDLTLPLVHVGLGNFEPRQQLLTFISLQNGLVTFRPVDYRDSSLNDIMVQLNPGDYLKCKSFGTDELPEGFDTDRYYYFLYLDKGDEEEPVDYTHEYGSLLRFLRQVVTDEDDDDNTIILEFCQADDRNHTFEIEFNKDNDSLTGFFFTDDDLKTGNDTEPSIRRWPNICIVPVPDLPPVTSIDIHHEGEEHPLYSHDHYTTAKPRWKQLDPHTKPFGTPERKISRTSGGRIKRKTKRRKKRTVQQTRKRKNRKCKKVKR
jgi:hypothetical protein